MSLTTWKRRSPLASVAPGNGEIARLRDEMERTIDRLLGEPFGLLAAIKPKALRSAGWIPPLDVSETET